MINVLIVEDDPMVAELNKRYIKSLNDFNVLSIVSNGEDALKFCRTHDVDLILLDIYMPKIDGITFLKELRKRFMMIDVILVTAAKECQMIDSALKLGAVDYLIKPFEYERLKKSLENYHERYKLLRGTSTIKQEDLDSIRKNFEQNSDSNLTKGLHKKTLERIRNLMKDNAGKQFSSEIIAEEMSLSKVTVRRYLEYLESIGEVELEVKYGSMGRPSHLYRYICR